MATKSKTSKRTCIITTTYRDLYYGTIEASDAQIAKERAVRVDACRHIAYWKGPTGGLTSLAASGPGPGSRIGAPVDGSLITGVAHVFPVTKEAQAKFAAIQPYGDGSGYGYGDGDGSGYGDGSGSGSG